MEANNYPLRVYEQKTEWASGKKLIVYHTNWATYGRNFQVKDLPIQYVSDVNYAFYDLRPDPASGCLVPTSADPWADTDKRFTNPQEGIPPPDTWNDDPNAPPVTYGNLGQFLKLKKIGMAFNLGLSVGGWSWSKHFSDAVKGPREREAFVEGILKIFDKHPGVFNRIDLDWEYISPVGQNYGNEGNVVRAEDPANFAAFLALLRTRLDATDRRHFEISACVSGDPAKVPVLPLQAMVTYLDTINIMTYDFASSAWGPCPAGHHTNLLSTPYSPLSVDRAVSEYMARGVPPHKIVIGVAFFSRGFNATDGLGRPSNGLVPDRSWEDGVCDYKTLPRPGAVEMWDEQAQAGYSYDAEKKILNSYDTVRSVREKCK
ncbi:hypothetical protein HK104_005138 [Borealophlyctis nickersoniae]|nr:hypothetical protein HK104_005138 [Borealophlyctis nickersoniae]